jgi:hypothetical protein
MADMIDAKRREQYGADIDRLRATHPNLPSEEEYDYPTAFQNGWIDMSRAIPAPTGGLRKAVSEAEGKPQEPTEPFYFLDERGYVEDGWGPGNVFNRIRNYEFTTGQRQIINPGLRTIGVGLTSATENVVREAADVTGLTDIGHLMTDPEAFDTPEGKEMANHFRSMIDEAYENPFGEFGAMQVNSANGIAGMGEFFASEVIEFTAPLLASRGIIKHPGSFRVNYNAPVWNRALARLGNSIVEAVNPQNIVGEYLYAQGIDNHPEIVTAENLRDPGIGNIPVVGHLLPEHIREFGFEGEWIDALEEADPETQRSIGNFLEGMILFEALRWSGVGAKAMVRGDMQRVTYTPQFPGKAAVRDYAFKKMEGVMNEVAVVNKALGTSIALPNNPLKLKGKTRFGTTGQYRAAPQGIDTPQKLQNLSNILVRLAEEGEPGKGWYDESSRQILDAVGGDKELAETVVKILAITSSSTDVKSNTKFALDAIAQHMTGEPIKTGRFPAAMSKKIEGVLRGEEWSGQKTNSFYINLMKAIDPAKVKDVTTQDMWMARGFGYTGDTFSSSVEGKAGETLGSYGFAEGVTKDIAEHLGWQGDEVQAAIWVAMKARYEAVKSQVAKEVKDKGIEPKSAEHLALWRERALEADTIDQKQLEKAMYSYAQGLETYAGQVSFEAIPGRSTGDIPWIHDAPPQVRADFNYKMMNALLDGDGNDILARELGLPNLGTVHGFGGWDGDVNLSGQLRASIPGTTEGITSAATKHVEAYAAALGKMFRQEGVGYHRDVPGQSRPKSNGVHLDFGRTLTEAETRMLYEAVSARLGTTDIAPIPAVDGVKFINFGVDEGKAFVPFSGIDNKQFQEMVKEALVDLDLPSADVVYFKSQGNLLQNDWEVNPNGEGFERIISETGLQDSVERARNILEPRVEAVRSQFQGGGQGTSQTQEVTPDAGGAE